MDHDFSDVSSDTSGSVPGSPGAADLHDDDHAEQVTLCRWDGCARDRGNMDALVRHIHDDHIGTRKATYACQWDDCSRKGMAHASGYALRAHMRSHTKEKPFYCSLPECDRSFTRSDALAKHMRTVHETEALRPSDPIPKSHPNHPQNHAPTSRSRNAHAGVKRERSDYDSGDDDDEDYAREDGFTRAEARMAPKELLRLLRQKQAWAEQEAEELRETLAVLGRRRREAWIKKELLLNRVLVKELGEEEAARLSLEF
ncbi:hypothetical protein EDC01DRAFT_620630 [Geopyxis carbonaria]|nr:hypothetical protein EDC01DRAFT_620630 [Geopyxis carbonaria]